MGSNPIPSYPHVWFKLGFGWQTQDYPDGGFHVRPARKSDLRKESFAGPGRGDLPVSYEDGNGMADDTFARSGRIRPLCLDGRETIMSAWLIEELGVLDIKDEEAFDDRLRVQKAAFLLKRLGVAPFTRYGFSLYIHGPYSPELAKEYYEGGGVGLTGIGPGEKATLTWFMSHGNDWLEIASSIMSIEEYDKKIGRDAVYDTVRLSKPWVRRRAFDDVYDELRKHDL